jgi:hypothetical protein
MEEWLKKLRDQKLSFTNELVPGRRNTLSLILPTTKPEDFGFLCITLDVNTVSLGTAFSK